MAIALPKGTHDVYLDEARGYDYIEQVMKAVANCYKKRNVYIFR